MVIDLTKCADGPLHMEQQVDVSSLFASYPEVELLTTVDLVLEVAVAGPRRYSVSGGFDSHARPYCVRCLESFPMPIRGQFRLTYLPASEREKVSDQADVAFYEEDRLDVLPLLEEQMNLAFPMRFLCSEACNGLCSSCGANRNRTACGCGPSPESSPFESLRDRFH